MALTFDNKIKLSWGDVEDVVKEICEKIIFETPLVDSVYGIPRGGLIPATLISHKLSLPYVSVIGKNTLVVDDICDSGITMKNSPGIYFAALYYKPHTSCFIPDVYGRLHEGDEWLIYPWETYNSPAMQDYLKEDQDKFGHLADANYIGGLTMPKTNTNKVGKNG